MIMHKMSLCKSDLDAAQAKVRECQETMENLQREVEEAEGAIVAIESGIGALQLQDETLDTSGSVGPGSIDSLDHNSDS